VLISAPAHSSLRAERGAQARCLSVLEPKYSAKAARVCPLLRGQMGRTPPRRAAAIERSLKSSEWRLLARLLSFDGLVLTARSGRTPMSAIRHSSRHKDASKAPGLDPRVFRLRTQAMRFPDGIRCSPRSSEMKPFAS
jgi:hypothetical protein